MKSIDTDGSVRFTYKEWAIVNGKTGELYLYKKYNNSILTFTTRDEARDEKASLKFIIGFKKAAAFRVEKINVTYERIS